MSFGSRAEKLHGHGHDLHLHPTGDGFVAPKAKRHGSRALARDQGARPAMAFGGPWVHDETLTKE
jgi:hypothetical protein